MLDAGNIAKHLLRQPASPRWRNVLASVFGVDEENIANWLPWLIAMHDIGKISAPFQDNHHDQRARLLAEGFELGGSGWNNDPYHANISALFFEDGLDNLPIPPSLRQAWVEALAGHHGRFSTREIFREARYKLKREPVEWLKMRQEAGDILKNVFLSSQPDRWPEPPNLSAATMILNGITILCDWLGSDENCFHPQPEAAWQEYLGMSARQAQQMVEKAGFFQPVFSQAPANFTSLFFNFTNPRPLQLAIDDIPQTIINAPCLAIIESPTGEGKTEAALALAHRLAQYSGSDEIYYALPTTATSNQMYSRLQKYILERLGLPERVKLVHGQAFLFEDDFTLSPLGNGNDRTYTAAAQWFGSDKRKSLLMPFGVGTVDQAELAALNVRFTVLRLLGMAGKVIIFDEVHAYDTYMTTIIERLLNWLSVLGSSVILLSATLPIERRQALLRAYNPEIEISDEPQAYPSLWVIGKNGCYHAIPEASQPDRRLDLNIRDLRWTDEEYQEKAKWLFDSVAEGGCACWITNTVDRAQKIYAALENIAPPDLECLLIHARFPGDDRQRLEERLMKLYGPDGERPWRGIVIGTQVLEQSLDLDFDVMVSDLAPVDFLLQRAGRMHRHSFNARPEKHARPRLWINLPRDEQGNPDLSVDKFIYDEYILLKTWQILAGREEICLPGDYRRLVEAVYQVEELTSGHPDYAAWIKLQKKCAKAREEARLRILPEAYPDRSFCAQIAQLTFEEDENNVGWLVAQTRLGEESLTVIPLECSGDQIIAWPGGPELDLNLEAPWPVQKKLMRRSIRISNRQAVLALKGKKAKLPRSFSESALLKECIPLLLTNGEAVIKGEKGAILFSLHPRLGLVIRKQGA